MQSLQPSFPCPYTTFAGFAEEAKHLSKQDSHEFFSAASCYIHRFSKEYSAASSEKQRMWEMGIFVAELCPLLLSIKSINPGYKAPAGIIRLFKAFIDQLKVNKVVPVPGSSEQMQRHHEEYALPLELQELSKTTISGDKSLSKFIAGPFICSGIYGHMRKALTQNTTLAISLIGPGILALGQNKFTSPQMHELACLYPTARFTVFDNTPEILKYTKRRETDLTVLYTSLFMYNHKTLTPNEYPYCEIEAAMLNPPQAPNISYIHLDLDSKDFSQQERVDAVVMTNVLGLLENPLSSLRKVASMVKKGGYLYIDTFSSEKVNVSTLHEDIGRKLRVTYLPRAYGNSRINVPEKGGLIAIRNLSELNKTPPHARQTKNYDGYALQMLT